MTDEESEKQPTPKPRRPVPPRPSPSQLAKLGISTKTPPVEKNEMDPIHYLLNGDQTAETVPANSIEAPTQTTTSQPESSPVEMTKPLIDFTTIHEAARPILNEAKVAPVEVKQEVKPDILSENPDKNVDIMKKFEELRAENENLRNKQTVIQEKYQRVCERFHYVEGKIQRRDDARLATEKTILATLEKLQLGLTKLDEANKKNSELGNAVESKLNNHLESDSRFKDALKRYFQVEASNLKVRENQLIDIFQSMNMEEEVLLLGGDEDTNVAEVAAAYKKQAKQQAEDLEAYEICQICVEKYDNNSRPRVVLTTCGHVLCADCAENIILSSPFAVSGTGACPTCSQHFSRHQIVKVIL